MKILKVILLGAGICIAGLTFAIPRVLIGEYRVNNQDGDDVTLRFAELLAKELDHIGQVEPIVWSMTDPLFRQIAVQKNLETNITEPHPTAIDAITKAINPDYYLEIIATKEADGTKPIAKLYRPGSSRALWEFGTLKGRKYQPSLIVNGKLDEKSTNELTRDQQLRGQGFDGFMVFVNGLPDWYSVAATLSRTMSNHLADTAFKDLPRRPSLSTPTESPGYIITASGINIFAPPPDECLSEVDALLAKQQNGLATILLRDAIDQNPSHPGLRIKLTSMLMTAGMYESAAEEAERAARLSQDQSGLWLTAAKAWFFAQNANRAELAINEALARGANDALSQALIGDVRLLQGDYIRAIESYTSSIQTGPRPNTILGRAMAYGMAGLSEECQADLKSLVDVNPELYSDAYFVAIQLAEIRFDSLANQLREIVPFIKMSPTKPELIARASMIEKSSHAISQLVNLVPIPTKFRDSHQTRSLAHKLLAQSSSEISEFARTGNNDIGEEGLLSLGEALKLIPGVRRAFNLERSEN